MKYKTIGFPYPLLNKNKKIQTLFNWKKFYKLKCHTKYPAILCFPDFFANSIFAILNWTSYHYFTKDAWLNEINKQISRLFDILEIIVNLIINDEKYKVRLKPTKEIWENLYEIINENVKTGHKFQEKHEKEGDDDKPNTITNNNINNFEHFFLEWYLKDEESQLNYQKILNKINLELNGVTNIQELIEYLHEKKCCESIESIPTLPPHSVHYVNQSKISNCSDLPIELHGPSSWGPVYWNIFHALAHYARKKSNSDNESDFLITLHAIICILPLIIPCHMCMVHYITNVNPSSIPIMKNVSQYETIYNDIHDTVTKTKTI